MTTDTGIRISAVKSPNAVRRLDKDAKDNKAKMGDMQPALINFDMEEDFGTLKSPSFCRIILS
jgi:hypothetical protein